MVLYFFDLAGVCSDFNKNVHVELMLVRTSRRPELRGKTLNCEVLTACASSEKEISPC